jgi:hypothetical protein
MTKNYVSVTAGKDAEEVRAVLAEFEKAGYSVTQEHIPVLGIQVSEKTLNGIKPKNFRFARFAEIPSLMKITEGKAMPVIHYNTKNTRTLYEQVSKCFEEIREYCSMVQVNATFPDISQIEKIKELGLKVSLQVDCRGMNLNDVIDKVASYGSCLDYVLIDPSRGRGDIFDIEDSAFLYSEIKARQPDCGLVFAGGFCGDNAEDVLKKVIDRIQTKDFSICAEGKLRDKASDEHWGQDNLNIDKVRKYLQAVKKILN